MGPRLTFFMRSGAMGQLRTVAMTGDDLASMQREANRLPRLLDASDKFVRPSADPSVPGSRIDAGNKAGI